MPYRPHRKSSPLNQILSDLQVPIYIIAIVAGTTLLTRLTETPRDAEDLKKALSDRQQIAAELAEAQYRLEGEQATSFKLEARLQASENQLAESDYKLTAEQAAHFDLRQKFNELSGAMAECQYEAEAGQARNAGLEAEIAALDARAAETGRRAATAIEDLGAIRQRLQSSAEGLAAVANTAPRKLAPGF